MLIIFTILGCQNYEHVNMIDGGFFALDSYRLVSAIGIAASLQPVVGFLSDLMVRVNFCFWLLFSGVVGCTIPLAAQRWYRSESIEQILAGNTNGPMFMALLTLSFLGAVSL